MSEAGLHIIENCYVQECRVRVARTVLGSNGKCFPLKAKEVSMQMLALLSSLPPAPARHDQKRCSQLSLATQFAAALAIIAVVVAGLEIASRDRVQPAARIASIEQEF
jgi:hypothetical protein